MKETKEKIRTEIKAARKAIDTNFAKKASLAICRKLRKVIFENSCRKISAFYPSFGEPDILPVLEEFLNSSGEIYLPCWTENKGYMMRRIANFAKGLKNGRFSIPEPVSGVFAENNFMPDLWLVPGIAFSEKGIRLGYGEGTYDRLLTGFSGLKIGICYDFQVFQKLPCEDHDIKMDYLVTEKNIYICNQQRKKEIIYE